MSSPPSPFIQDLMLTPITAVTCAVLILIWFPLWNNRVSPDKVCFSYTKVVTQGEWWRCLTAAHSHFDLAHIGFNIMSLWSCRVAEMMLGPWVFFVQSLALVVLSKVIMLGVVYVVSSRLPSPQGSAWQEGGSVGYSAVIFAWMTILCAHLKGYSSVFGLVDVPSVMMPVVSLFLTQLIVRNASFVGHAAGIVAGVLAVFGMLDWAKSVYWCAVFLFWVGVMLAYSLKATTQVPMPCIDYVNRAMMEEEEGGREGGGGRPPQRVILHPEGQMLGGGGGNGGGGGTGGGGGGPMLV